MNLTGICSLVIVLTQLGCMDMDSVDSLDIDDSQAEVSTPEGTSLNGTSLNGTGLNGTGLNGAELDGVSPNGASLNGAGLNGISLNGSTLASTTYPGQYLVGSQWKGKLSDGASVSLRIDATGVLLPPNEDVRVYYVSYATNGGWAPLCGTSVEGNSVAVIALSGVWSYQQGVPGGGGFTPSSSKMTFACRGKAIAKCVELGYKPWLSIPGEQAGYPEHLVACTRMLRADYCGDGRSWTVNGTLINIYDQVGIQEDAEPWKIEAEWSSTGARCTNQAPFTRLSLSAAMPPGCFDAKISSICGALGHFNTGTALMNEFAH